MIVASMITIVIYSDFSVPFLLSLTANNIPPITDILHIFVSFVVLYEYL